MITLERPAYYGVDRYADYCALSTDDLSEIKANNGDRLYEIDTGITYRYDATIDGWTAQPTGGGGGTGSGDFMANGTVPMTGNLRMNGNAIMGVKSISDADTGLAIESNLSMNNHPITDLLDPVDEQDAATKKYVDDRAVVNAEGKATADLDLNEHAIINAHKISTDGVAPIYIGATIEAGDNTSPRLTATSDGMAAAFVKANTQSTYVPLFVANPTNSQHAATKVYVDSKVTAMLPPITEEANGKVLGVVNGALAWVDNN